MSETTVAVLPIIQPNHPSTIIITMLGSSLI
jgi:hypothetical protein